MKKSKTITLVLLTSTILLGCEDKVRNKYADWDDCVKDYQDPSRCKVDTEKTGSGYHMVYYGPWYRNSDAGNQAHNPSAISKRSTGIARSGWGSIGGRGGS